MSDIVGRPEAVADGPDVTDVERLLELYGRSASEEATSDLPMRIMAAVDRAVLGVTSSPTAASGRREAAPGTRRPRVGPRWLARMVLAALLAAGLAAAALGSTRHDGETDRPVVNGPTRTPGPTPSSPPRAIVSPGPSDATDESGAPESVADQDGSRPTEPDADAPFDDDRTDDGVEESDVDARGSSGGADEVEPDRTTDPADTEPDADED